MKEIDKLCEDLYNFEVNLKNIIERDKDLNLVKLDDTIQTKKLFWDGLKELCEETENIQYLNNIHLINRFIEGIKDNECNTINEIKSFQLNLIKNKSKICIADILHNLRELLYLQKHRTDVYNDDYSLEEMIRETRNSINHIISLAEIDQSNERGKWDV